MSCYEYHWYAGRLSDVADGSATAPVTTPGPTAKWSRTERFTAPIGGNPDDFEGNATVSVYSQALPGSTQMNVAVAGEAHGTGTAPDADSLGGAFTGRVLAGGTGAGTGVFGSGRRESDSGIAKGAEFNVSNFGAMNAPPNPNGMSRVVGVWVSHLGLPGVVAGAAFEAGSFPNAGQFDSVFHAPKGAAANATLRDDGDTHVSLLIGGSHVYAMDVANALLIALVNVSSALVSRQAMSGAAGTLPHQVAGYLPMAVDGHVVKVPFFNS